MAPSKAKNDTEQGEMLLTYTSSVRTSIQNNKELILSAQS